MQKHSDALTLTLYARLGGVAMVTMSPDEAGLEAISLLKAINEVREAVGGEENIIPLARVLRGEHPVGQVSILPDGSYYYGELKR